MALVSCLLGRRVWTTIRDGRPLYPHLYVMLVATSGYGKSSVTMAVREALRDYTGLGSGLPVPPVVFAPTEITFPRLIGMLGQVFREAPMGADKHQCYAFIADEVGVIFGNEATVAPLQQLSKIWDMEETYGKKTVRSQEQKTETCAHEHYMVSLMGAQPAWIEEAIPLSRFKLGMPARTHFVLGKTETGRTFSQGNGVDFGAT